MKTTLLVCNVKYGVHVVRCTTKQQQQGVDPEEERERGLKPASLNQLQSQAQVLPISYLLQPAAHRHSHTHYTQDTAKDWGLRYLPQFRLPTLPAHNLDLTCPISCDMMTSSLYSPCSMCGWIVPFCLMFHCLECPLSRGAESLIVIRPDSSGAPRDYRSLQWSESLRTHPLLDNGVGQTFLCSSNDVNSWVWRPEAGLYWP